MLGTGEAKEVASWYQVLQEIHGKWLVRSLSVRLIMEGARRERGPVSHQ